jgi:hypothetical protein
MTFLLTFCMLNTNVYENKRFIIHNVRHISFTLYLFIHTFVYLSVSHVMTLSVTGIYSVAWMGDR